MIHEPRAPWFIDKLEKERWECFSDENHEINMSWTSLKK